MTLHDDRTSMDVSETGDWYATQCKVEAARIDGWLARIDLALAPLLAEGAEEEWLQRRHLVWAGPQRQGDVKLRSRQEAVTRLLGLLREQITDELSADAREAREVAADD